MQVFTRLEIYGDCDANPARLEGVLRQLTSLIPGPAHQPNVLAVASGAHACICAALETLQPLLPALQNFTAELSWLEAGLTETRYTSSQNALLGWATDFPLWTFLATNDLSTEKHGPIRLLLGLDLAVAFLKGESGRRAHLAMARQHIKSIGQTLDSGTPIATEVQRVIAKLQKRAGSLATVVSFAPGGREFAKLNAAVVCSLQSSLSSLRTEERRAAGSDLCLSKLETIRALADLKAAAARGDGDALAKLIAFSVGLPWHIALMVPFHDGLAPIGAVAWISVREGCSYIDLRPVLSELAKRSTPRHLPTQLILPRPLPLDVANLLFEACSANPNLRVVGNLMAKQVSSKNKLSIDGLHHSASIARLIASGGPISLEESGRRDLAAFATLNFELINKSDLHYITPASEEIWTVCAGLYKATGLGCPVPRTRDCAETHIGSRLTPSAQWIREMFDEARAELGAARCGRRYRLSTLVKHHNAYARWVGLFLQFALGGRHRREIKFNARDVNPENLFALLLDKPIGPTLGQTPLPMPPAVKKQIVLWKAHIVVLVKRLAKLRAADHDQSLAIVTAIVNNQDLPLLFTLSAEGSCEPLLGDDIFKGCARDINRDFGRHFNVDEMTRRGLPFEDGQDWLRHDPRGVSHQAATSEHVKYQYLARTSQAIGEILLKLNIRPIVGLSKEGV